MVAVVLKTSVLRDDIGRMWISYLLVVICVTSSCAGDGTDAKIAEMEKVIAALQANQKVLLDQTMMTQLAMEERVRSDGASGVKQSRVVSQGSKPYFVQGFTGSRMIAVHDHSNHIRTIGLGEIIAVLNGVEFKTRHNDYPLERPGDPSKGFDATDVIEAPDVPPEVTSKSTVKEQIAELKEWFKAFRDSDHSVRDYRKYFKPVLCYLEGYWTKPSKTDTIDEPFTSDRHKIDAKTWQELLEKVRFSAYTGRKDAGENLAYLPRKIMEIVSGTPIVAQWNYRIRCHNLTKHVPLTAFRVVDDLMARLRKGDKLKGYQDARAARFQLNWRLPTFNKWRDASYPEGFLDHLMAEIPGLDGYHGNLTDSVYDYVANKLLATETAQDPINTAFFSKLFKEFRRGAMGVQRRVRGFSDLNMFMAMTTNPKIASIKMTECQVDSKGDKQCKEYRQSWSYAIPLEIVYMTPLQRWNPYNLAYHGASGTTEGGVVTTGGRNGGMLNGTAYNGTNSNTFYRVPAEFFSGGESTDKADTAVSAVGVLDQSGVVRSVSASGYRIFQDIAGVGKLRQRWPIAPAHVEGSAQWKEMDALKDVALGWRENFDMFY